MTINGGCPTKGIKSECANNRQIQQNQFTYLWERVNWKGLRRHDKAEQATCGMVVGKEF